MAASSAGPPRKEPDILDPEALRPPVMVKRKKERDIAWLARSIMLFLVLFFSLTTIAVFTIGLSLIILAVFGAISLFFTLTGGFFIERFGDRTGVFIAGWSSKRAARADLSGDLEKARVQKRERDFEGALRTVNALLKQEPENADALFLKGAILWDGFQNGAAARGYLKRVMELRGIDDHLYRWARELRDRISRASLERD